MQGGLRWQEVAAVQKSVVSEVSAAGFQLDAEGWFLELPAALLQPSYPFLPPSKPRFGVLMRATSPSNFLLESLLPTPP